MLFYCWSARAIELLKCEGLVHEKLQTRWLENATKHEEINNFTKWKNESVDVTFMRAITHQKHLAQAGCSTRSSLDIFNTLRVFTEEPFREQETKLECMKMEQWNTT